MKTNLFDHTSRDEFKQFIEHADSLCTIIDRMTEAVNMYNNSCESGDSDINLNEIACLVVTRYKLNKLRDTCNELFNVIETHFGEVMFDILKSRFDDVCNSLDLYDKEDA